MLETLVLECLVSVGRLVKVEDLENQEKMEQKEKKAQMDHRDLQDPWGHQGMQVHLRGGILNYRLRAVAKGILKAIKL